MEFSGRAQAGSKTSFLWVGNGLGRIGILQQYLGVHLLTLLRDDDDFRAGTWSRYVSVSHP